MPLARRKRVGGVSRFGRNRSRFGVLGRVVLGRAGVAIGRNRSRFGRNRSRFGRDSVAKTRLHFGVSRRLARVDASGYTEVKTQKKARFPTSGNRAARVATCRAFLCFD